LGNAPKEPGQLHLTSLSLQWYGLQTAAQNNTQVLLNLIASL
jgi:hypothetical protein